MIFPRLGSRRRSFARSLGDSVKAAARLSSALILNQVAASSAVGNLDHSSTSSVTAAMPRISVIIPVYNASAYIAGTLASVLAQTRPPFEIIVVNDGSPDADATERALAPYRTSIVYLSQGNRGPSAARNTGIRAARGDYVAFLDSDDEWLPGFLEKQSDYLVTHPATDLVYSDGIVFGAPPLAGRRLMSVSPSRVPVTFESLVTEACTVLTTCTVARRSAVTAAGMFDERYWRSEDFHLWLKMAHGGARIAAHPAVLVRHRRRVGSLAHDTAAMVRAFIEALRDVDARLPLTPSQRSLVAERIGLKEAELAVLEGKRLFISGNYGGAALELDRACRLHPVRASQWRLRAISAAMRMAPRLLHRAYGAMREPALAAAGKEAS